MSITERQKIIMLAIILGNHRLPELQVYESLSDVTDRTLQRDLSNLLKVGMVTRKGEARSASYDVSDSGKFELALTNSQLETILGEEDRPAQNYYFEFLDVVKDIDIFSKQELDVLDKYNEIYTDKMKKASADIIRRERERITIELSWKSSKIEGNTYTLLETESLIKEGVSGSGRSQQETIMILNHKSALDFAERSRDFFGSSISPSLIIELHKILVNDMNVEVGLRKTGVGITGSIYRPLNNRFQISEELGRFCDVINSKRSVYEKALLSFVYICYLQPFNDGNKRTARILANAILSANGYFPLSLRAVDVNTYKLAILAFYELRILGNVKKVFIDQAKFAAENYAI